MEDKPFFSQGAYGCAMYPRVKCNGTRSNPKKRKTKRKEMSKIVENSAISHNEIAMGKKINKIMKGKKDKKLIGVSRFCETKPKYISKFKKCKIISNPRSSKFLILYSQYIPSTSLRSYLYTDFTRGKWVKTYDFILNVVRILQREEIVHHDLTTNNMIVSKKKTTLHVIDFGLSFCIRDCFLNKSLNYDYIKLLFFPDTNFYLWPLEHHILGYMVRYDHIPNQEELLYLVQQYYGNKNNALFQYEPIVLDGYIREVYAFYEHQYIHSELPLEVHIRDLITQSSLTWDLYTTSYMLLRRLMSKPVAGLEEMVPFLNRALHYDYTKRPSLHDHQAIYFKIMDDL